MPSRVPRSSGDLEEEDWWTDKLQTCVNSGIGYSTNIKYKHHGQPTHDHQMEDQSFRIVHELNNGNKIRLVGVFDGFDNGKGVSDFAAQRMVADIIFDEALQDPQSEDEIKNSLRAAFSSVDQGYFHSIGELLAERMELQMKIAAVTNLQCLEGAMYKNMVARIETLNHQVLGGATGVVALIADDRLFIANAGDARGVLVKSDPQGGLMAYQVTKQHDINDKDEVARLLNLGLTEYDIEHFGIPICTRCIGDYRRKAGYKEVERLCGAREEPVIAVPEVQGGFKIDDSFRFLILMSSGVFTALEHCADGSDEGSASDQTINAKIAGLVATEFCQQRRLNGVAQAVVDSISREVQEAFAEGKLANGQQIREDMTLLICNFSQPLPMAHKPSHSNVHLDSVSIPSRPLDLPLGMEYPASGQSTLTIRDDQSKAGSSTYFATNELDDEDDDYYDEEAAKPFQLDEQGRIAPYVNFDSYYAHPDREKIEREIKEIMDGNSADKAETPVKFVL